jgi:AraC-like DNA-binding protein
MLDLYVRGLGTGALIVTLLVTLLSPLAWRARLTTGLMVISAAAWLVTENVTSWDLFGHSPWLAILAGPIAAYFWLFIRVTFDDVTPRAIDWVPAVVLEAISVTRCLGGHPTYDELWALANLGAFVLVAHAAYVIARGYAGDLLDMRRRVRTILFGLICLFGLFESGVALALRAGLPSNWAVLEIGQPAGGVVFGALILGVCALFLNARLELFAAGQRSGRRPDAGSARQDARTETADLAILDKLTSVMDGGAWRQEGLTVGALSLMIDVPEYRLRRVINGRLGYRNFADFLNSHRIAAAQAALSDPALAARTVAAIAFDLGYGSLGPFNRAFRAASGMSPTEWRLERLESSLKPQKVP